MNLNKSFPPANVGDTVRVAVPDVDRGRVDTRNVLFIVLSVDDCIFFKLGNQFGTLPQLYTRNQFTISPEKLLSLDDVAEEKSLREIAGLQSLSGGQGFKKCRCKAKCESNKCRCKASGVLCNG